MILGEEEDEIVVSRKGNIVRVTRQEAAELVRLNARLERLLETLLLDPDAVRAALGIPPCCCEQGYCHDRT